MIKSARWRTLLVIAIGLAAVVAIVWYINQRRRPDGSNVPVIKQEPSVGKVEESSPTQTPALPSPSPTPSGQPDEFGVATPSPSVESSTHPDLTPSFVGKLKLIVPVQGVRTDQLLDTYSDARSEGRVHDAIDIPAAAGTPVVAAADGEIIKLFQSERGGTTIYQLSSDRKLVYYYAHLQGYAPGLAAGTSVRQGEVIGFVGDTGNAGTGNSHLHFSIAIVPDPNRYWEGTNINPFPILRGR
jgi:murein DD-endopeptidase MepM/ murein hydrolase activator NlpD